MNYNENTFNSMPGSSSSRRLTRRPMETPGLDMNNMPQQQQSQYNYAQPTLYPHPDSQSLPPQQQFYYNDFTSVPSQPQQMYENNDYGYSSSVPLDTTDHRHYTPSPGPSSHQTQPTMFIPSTNLVDALGSNPILAGATVRYGQKILGQVVDENVGKYASGISAQIKYYFAVDTRYVISKLCLLLFPFTHRNWSIMMETAENQTDNLQRARPKTDINAPDLYIPTVSFVTYLLLLGLILGKHGQFSPELLSVQASRVLAWELILVAMEVLGLYVTNIDNSLRVLDLTAYSGYKYFGIVSCIPVGLLLGKTAFNILLLYINIAFIYFLLFSMRWQLNSISTTVSNVNHPVVLVEYKRKRTLYFLILALVIQPLTSWYLTSNLIFTLR